MTQVILKIIIFLIIYYAILNPIVENKKKQIEDMNKKKEETVKFVKQIKSKKNKIKKLKPKYDEYSTLFHTKASYNVTVRNEIVPQ